MSPGIYIRTWSTYPYLSPNPALRCLKLQGCLNPGGRLVIVEQFALEAGTVLSGRSLAWGFIRSMEDLAYTFPPEADVKNLLTKTGFRFLSEICLPDNFLLIDAAVFPQ
jgi:hypothetical protein